MKNKIIIILVILIAIALGVYIGINHKDIIKFEKNNQEERIEYVNVVQDVEQDESVISQEKAEKILVDKYGTKDEETGNTMSYGYITTVQDKDGNKYYAFRQSWLVDNSHLSFLQNVFVSFDGKTIKTVASPAGYEENDVVEFDD